MSEKRFKVKKVTRDERPNLFSSVDIVGYKYYIVDKIKGFMFFNFDTDSILAHLVCDKLNEQQTEIDDLKEENEQLRQFINKGRRLSVKEIMDNANENVKLKRENEQLKEELKLEQDFASRWQKESEMLAKENEQLHHELQQIKEYLQTKINECKNHKKMKEIIFGVEQAVGYEKALLQFQKGLKRRLNDD